MYAIIETGGKQYQVHEGDEIFVEKLDAEGEITFDKVIMVGKRTMGHRQPYSKVKIEAINA